MKKSLTRTYKVVAGTVQKTLNKIQRDGAKFPLTYAHWMKSTSNCKLAFVDSIQGALGENEIFDCLVDSLDRRRVYFCSLNKSNHLSRLKDSPKIKIIYCVDVPTGYGGSYQKHVGFVRTDASEYAKRALSRSCKVVVGEKLNKESKLLSMEQMDKIKRYKSKYHLKKYLLKLTESL